MLLPNGQNFDLQNERSNAEWAGLTENSSNLSPTDITPTNGIPEESEISNTKLKNNSDIKGSRMETPELFASREQFTDEKGFAKIVFKVKKALQKFIKEINNIIAASTNAETKALRDDVVVLEFIQSQFERILDEVNEKRIQNAKQSAEAAADKGENVNSAVVSASRMEMNIESVEEAQKDITAA